MSERTMRGKFSITEIRRFENIDQVVMKPVFKKGGYPDDGLDEDNTFARFTPSGELTLTIANPALLGKLNPGEIYYLDFIKAE